MTLSDTIRSYQEDFTFIITVNNNKSPKSLVEIWCFSVLPNSQIVFLFFRWSGVVKWQWYKHCNSLSPSALKLCDSWQIFQVFEFIKWDFNIFYPPVCQIHLSQPLLKCKHSVNIYKRCRTVPWDGLVRILSLINDY